MKCNITMALQPINFSNKRLLGVTLYTVIIDCFHTSENRKRRLKKKIVPISNCEPMTVLLCVKPFLLFSRFCQQQIISVPAGYITVQSSRETLLFLIIWLPPTTHLCLFPFSASVNALRPRQR